MGRDSWETTEKRTEWDKYPISSQYTLILMDDTIAYYDRHARNFVDDTLSIDMTPLYRRFLPLLPAGGHILDAGCGPGRDARAFRDLGYRVTAFDASLSMVEIASRRLGVPVQHLRFQECDIRGQFDGVWACASLLHIPLAELTDALLRLAAALKPSGVFYLSFKYGRGEREHHGRRFTDLDEAGLAERLRTVERLKIRETWTTSDLRPGRESEDWLNALLEQSG